ncbi:flagellar FliJ family protein [Buchnera aphidicola]|uniref:Uncharacterized protein n=1 Tax=Buchnera aphidicola (Therioaphis trifolii) TaxID=1241884 RepID=A0A4D6YM65_9GAMM|nr:flagellar FliJ family protein [Buchnera aphidicola]QCI27064.1 hypothetical protein D9V81_00300 [Buchnera aphidicola (Therioaphis trifolii)]
MLKKNIAILKNITKLKLEQLTFILYNIKNKKNKKKNQLYKIIKYYNYYIKNFTKKFILEFSFFKIKNFYQFLYYLEDYILKLKNKILKYNNDIKNKLFLWKKLNKKLKIWNILYDKIINVNKKKKNILNKKYNNQYYQIFLLKNIFFNKNK